MNGLSCPKMGRIQVTSASHLPLTSQGAHWDSEGSTVGWCWPRAPWLGDGSSEPAPTSLGVGSSQHLPLPPRRQKSPFMTPEDVICGRRREHSSTGLYIGNRPMKKPAQSKAQDFSMPLPFLFTPELQTGMKRGGGIAAHTFQVKVLESRTSKGQKPMPLLLRGLASACILQYNGVFLIPGCTSWNPGRVGQCHCHNFPCHRPNTDP